MLQVPLLLNSNKTEGPVVRVPRGTWVLGFHGEVDIHEIQLTIDGNPVTAQGITFEGPCNIQVLLKKEPGRMKFTIYAELINANGT